MESGNDPYTEIHNDLHPSLIANISFGYNMRYFSGNLQLMMNASSLGR